MMTFYGKHRSGYRQQYADRPCVYTWHGWHDEYSLVDSLRHVFRRGAMTASGMLGSITSVFVRFMKGRVSVVASTVCSGLFLNLTTADQYISIILTETCFVIFMRKKDMRTDY